MLRLPFSRSARTPFVLLSALGLTVLLFAKPAIAQLRPSLEAESRAAQPGGIAPSEPFPTYGPAGAQTAPAVSDGAVAEIATPDQIGVAPLEEDPFAPFGLRAGSFIFLPSLTQRLGYSSNADGFRGGKASAFSITEAALDVRSNWSRHQLEADLSGAWQEFLNDTTESLPEFDAEGRARFDLSRQWVARATLGYGLVSEAPTSVVLLDSPLALSDDRPLVHSFSGAAELEKTEGRLVGSVRGSIDHEAYGDLSLADGSRVAQDSRDNTVYLASLRLGYGGSPVLQPFVEGELGTRSFTNATAGQDDNSLISGLKTGLSFNRSEKLSGEISVGYAGEYFDGGDVEGITADASLNWSPVRDTSIALNLATSFDAVSSNIDDASRLYEGSLSFTRNFTRRWSGTLGLAASAQQFRSGREDTSASISLETAYAFNRNLAVLARLEHARFDSSEPTAVYEDTTAWLGLRLQK